MKKRKLFFGLLLALLTFFAININTQNFTYATSVTIKFLDTNGNILETEQTTQDDGTLSSLPSPTRDGYFFDHWEDASGQTITTSTTFDTDTILYAYFVTRPYSFKITKNADKFDVSETKDETDYNISISTGNETLLAAIKSIKTQVPETYEATIYFDNITLTEDLIFSEENEIDFQKLKLSGTIDLANYQIQNITTVRNSTLTLSSLTLNSSSNNNLIVIDGEKTKVYLENTTNFNNSYSSADKSNYSIYFNNSAAELNVTGSFSSQTKYLYNHKEGFSVKFESYSTTNEKISLTFPFSLDGKGILSTTGDKSQFEFIPLYDNFEYIGYDPNSTYIHIKVQFNINFNTNGGTLTEGNETITTGYSRQEQLNYPSNELTKDYHTLNGFAGKITISGTTYYFNKTMLETYLSSEHPSLTTFKESIDEVSGDGFTYYKNDKDDINFKAVKFMLDNGETPEFVALWSKTIYTISLDTKSGTYSGETTISGTHETSIDLSTIRPTKTGYEFKGWFSDEDYTTPFTSTSMPAENITVYAKWQANTHTLTIVLNNGEANVTAQVDYDTPLSDITNFNSLVLQKTGYTFTSWHTSEALGDDSVIDEESFKMPDNNVTLYAKWSINTYTITLYYNHKNKGENEVFKTITQEYNSTLNANEIMQGLPEFEGYEFLGWYKDKSGVEKFNPSNEPYYLPTNVPANDVNIYAKWHSISYSITYYTNNTEPYYQETLHFGSNISIISKPNITNYKFLGWYTDKNHTSSFNLTKMPSHNINVYAWLTEKNTISINDEQQIYEVSKKGSFVIDSKISGFKIEYLVDDEWTKTTPTKKGTYDVKITRSEDENYKAFSLTIENGLRITPNNVDLGVFILVLYALAILELVFAIILLFVTKQRKTYLTYIIALPFGTVSNSQFINFIIALVLAVFGFVLIMLELSKLKKLNGEIAKINTDQQDYNPPDVSENKSISENVNILLKKEGFFDEEKDEINKDFEEQNIDNEDNEIDNH